MALINNSSLNFGDSLIFTSVNQLNIVKSILTSYLAKSLTDSSGGKFVKDTLWKHTVAVALISKKIAEFIKKVNAEEAFISGLLHDIGKSVLLKNGSENYVRHIEFVVNEGVNELNNERETWGFSDVIIEPLVYHYNIAGYSMDNLLVPIVSLANKVAHRLGLAFYKSKSEMFELIHLGVNEEDFKSKIVKVAIEDYETMMGVL